MRCNCAFLIQSVCDKKCVKNRMLLFCHRLFDYHKLTEFLEERQNISICLMKGG